MPRRCVAGPSARGTPPKEGSGTSVPGTSSRLLDLTSASFGEHVRFRGRGPSTSTRRRQALAVRRVDGPSARLADRRPSQRIVPRLVPGRVTPSWSSPRGVVATPAAGPPEGKESLRYDPRYPVARPPHRHECLVRVARTSDPVLLDFHADWCGPCRQMRPAVEQLSPQGISGQVDRHRQGPRRWPTRYGVERRPDLHRRRRARAASSTAPAASSPPPRWSGSTWPPGPRPSRPASPTPMPSPATIRGPTRDDDRRRPVRRAGRSGRAATTPTIDREPETRRLPAKPSPIPTRRRPWSGSRSSARTRPASARGRSSTARPSSRSS